MQGNNAQCLKAKAAAVQAFGADYSFVSGRRDLCLDLSFAPFKGAVKAVAFDIDGTLCDSIWKIIKCARLAFNELKIPQPEENAIKAIIGKKLQEGLESLLPEGFMHLGDQVTHCYRDIFADLPEIRETRLFPWVGGVLRQLHESGFKIAYASGKSKRGIERSLAESVLGDYCDALCAGDEVPSKPHPAMAQLVARRLRLPTFTILGVGDAGMDVQLFQNASCVSCGVQSGVWSGEALLQLRPNLLLPHIGFLPQFLGAD